MQEIPIGSFSIGKGKPLALLSGPCVIETEDLALFSAEKLKKTCQSLGISLIYKSSYDKANRSSLTSFRGVGLEEGLRVLEKVKRELDLPVVTDVHTPEEAIAAAEVCDMIQIPAFLCRQTDLICAAASTKAAINIKKGQFMAPTDMKNVVDKAVSMGNNRILLTDRGVSFGYNNLVSDFRAIPLMQELGFPVCFDATHSVQLPGGKGSSSGGQRQFIPPLARAAIGAGANALFMETHPDPKNALSDKDSVVPLDKMEPLLRSLNQLYNVLQSQEPLCFDPVQS